MHERLTRRQAVVSGWEKQATQQIYLSFAVGLLGLIVSALQGTSKPWTRILTAALGFSVSAVTLFTNKVYTADYHTLQKSAAEARPLIEGLQEDIVKFELAQSPGNQSAIEIEFSTECGRIDQIEQRILGGASPSQEPPKNAGNLFRAWVAYAQFKPTAPAWTSTNLQNDAFSTYFVGIGESTSLTEAKSTSLKKAVTYGAHWLKGDPLSNDQAEPPPQVLEVVKQSADVVGTWFSYDPGTEVYRYYTRLRLTNELKALDVKHLPVCITQTVGLHELVRFEITQGPIYIYLDSLPLRLPGRADIFIFGNGLWSGSTRLVKRNIVKAELAKFDSKSYGKRTIESHKSATVSIDGENYIVEVDTSYKRGSAKVTLCTAK
jgi:hypothetical protein